MSTINDIHLQRKSELPSQSTTFMYIQNTEEFTNDAIFF